MNVSIFFLIFRHFLRENRNLAYNLTPTTTVGTDFGRGTKTDIT